MSKEAEYRKIYFQESDELLRLMNQNLLILEKSPKDTEAINAIFRAAHTLKSMSASMGFTKVSELSHKMESVLVQIRDGTIEATGNTVDILFKSFDCLESMVADLESDAKVQIDISHLVNELGSLMSEPIKFKEEKISDDLSLNIFEKRILSKVKSDGYNAYFMTITLEKSCVLKGVRAFMVFRNLHSIGEVIKSIPDSQSIQEDKFDLKFSCIFISKESGEVAKAKAFEVLEIKSVDISELKVDKDWEHEIADASETSNFGTSSAIAGIADGIRKLKSIRIDVDRLDKLMNLVEELTIIRLRITDASSKYADREFSVIMDGLKRLTDDLQNEVMNMRLVPVGQVFDRFTRMVRDLAKNEGKKVRFSVAGNDVELDRMVLDEIGDPLIHILRNAVDHGIESPDERKSSDKPEEGSIVLSATRAKNHVLIEVLDDGKGLDIASIKRTAIKNNFFTEKEVDAMTDEEIIMITTKPGFSTKNEATDISGRGVGLDVAKQKAEALGGTFHLLSTPGKGLKVSMKFPISTALTRALLVKMIDRTFAIPINTITEIIVAKNVDIKKVEHQETIMHRGMVLPLLRPELILASNSVKIPVKGDSATVTAIEKFNVVILEDGINVFGLAVEKLLSQQDIVIKPLTRELKGTKGISGATILGDGTVALVLDVGAII